MTITHLERTAADLVAEGKGILAADETPETLLMDLADIGGNVKDGCHIASMGGTWMVLAYGFGGLRDYYGTLSFHPQRPPEAQSLLRFPLTWHGRTLEIEIGPDTTTYSLRKGSDLVIRHDDEPITLTEANPMVSRPTLQPHMVTVGAGIENG